MTDLDYVAQTLLHIVLRPGFEFDMLRPSNEGETGFCIMWHRPGLNVTWYPILQIDHNGKTIYHREGPEYNSEHCTNWAAFLEEAANFLYDYQYDRLQEGGNEQP